MPAIKGRSTFPASDIKSEDLCENIFKPTDKTFFSLKRNYFLLIKLWILLFTALL